MSSEQLADQVIYFRVV